MNEAKKEMRIADMEYRTNKIDKNEHKIAK
jgi:hypothetical protein